MRAVKEMAYAKLNLFLDVVAKRYDGFHEIETVMHTVSLADEITVNASPAKVASVTIRIEGEGRLPSDNKNIAVKAAKLYMEHSGITAAIKINLTKNIPIAAGLAGGSADAAATLRAMNRLFNKRFTDKMLLSLAGELGSDVPYCLNGKTALCRGRGELVSRLADLSEINFVIALSSDERVSTPMAYTMLDEIYSNFDGTVPPACSGKLDSLLSAIEIGKVDYPSLFNIFEKPIFSICFEAEKIKSQMYALGASAAMMSGSGPSVFGIFPNSPAAESAAVYLSSLGYSAFSVKSV